MKHHRPGGFANRTPFSSCSRGWKHMTSKAIHRVGFFWGHSFPTSWLGLPSLCTWGLISPAIKDKEHLGFGSSLMTSFCFNYILRGSVPRYSHIPQVQGVRPEHVNWRSTAFRHMAPPLTSTHQNDQKLKKKKKKKTYKVLVSMRRNGFLTLVGILNRMPALENTHLP